MTLSCTSVHLLEEAPRVEAIRFHQGLCLQDEQRPSQPLQEILQDKQVQDLWAEGSEEPKELSHLWENLYNIITLQFVNHLHGAYGTWLNFCKLKKDWWKKFLICGPIFAVVLVVVTVLCLTSSESTKAMERSEEWISLRRKFFYFSDDTRHWTASKRFCSSQGSELAHTDTPEDMKFLKKHAGTSMYWIGLSRKLGESWKWTNGTTFNAGFEISGNGPFAFLNSDGVHSSRGFVDIKCICSKPICKTENKL